MPTGFQAFESLRNLTTLIDGAKNALFHQGWPISGLMTAFLAVANVAILIHFWGVLTSGN